MHCDELIEIIKEVEEKFVRTIGGTAPPLTIAAAAYAQLLPNPDLEIYQQLAKLFQLASMTDELRRGVDPRCDLCKKKRDLKRDLDKAKQGLQRRVNKVLQ